MNPPIPHAIRAQLNAAQELLRTHLGEQLRAIHLFGSAIDGGLQPHSDIDLLVTVAAPLPAPERAALMTALLAVSAPSGVDAALRPLEVTVVALERVVPWRYPAWRELQFGEWLRADLVAGQVEEPMEDHDLAILLTKARRHSVALAGPPADALFDAVPAADFRRALADTIAQWNEAPDWAGDEHHIVLALARIWYTASTGAIVPKDRAADWALARLPGEYRPLLARARARYLDGGGEHGDDAAAMAPFVRHLKAAIDAQLRASE